LLFELFTVVLLSELLFEPFTVVACIGSPEGWVASTTPVAGNFLSWAFDYPAKAASMTTLSVKVTNAFMLTPPCLRYYPPPIADVKEKVKLTLRDRKLSLRTK